jgi:hypothetical protein
MPDGRTFAAALAVALACTAHAQPADPARNAEAEAVRAALAALTQEQQTVYQQFQMVQALRAGQQQPLPAGAVQSYTPPPTPPSYDDLVRSRERYDAQQSQYQAELERLLARYRELEQRKQPLLERLTELAAPP